MQKLVLVSLATGVVSLVAPSQAAVIMLDFGPTAVGTATAISPYHSTTPAFTDTVWNTSLSTVDIAAGSLKFSDNTTATGVSVDLGTTSGTSSVLGTQPGNSGALGSSINSDIYGGATSAARDALYSGSAGSSIGVSMQVSGLAPGEYDIYYVGRNTSRQVGDNYTQTLRAAAASPSASFNYSAYASDTITYGTNAANSNVTTWVLGQNYAKLGVTIASGDVLNLAFTGAGIDTRGFVNAVQIVAVPEPTTVAGAMLLMPLLGRRRRN